MEYMFKKRISAIKNKKLLNQARKGNPEAMYKVSLSYSLINCYEMARYFSALAAKNGNLKAKEWSVELDNYHKKNFKE